MFEIVIPSKIENTDWQSITDTMHQNGYAIIPVFLPDERCEALKKGSDNPEAYRKTVIIKRYRFGKGDMLIFATSFKPEKGTKGYYRVTVKHGVSEIRSEERHTLEIIFHDALT